MKKCSNRLLFLYFNLELLVTNVVVFVQSREVIDNMMKIGEANARLKQMEVALDTAQLGEKNAETEATLAKEKAEALKLEVKQIALMVSVTLGDFMLFTTSALLFFLAFAI